MAYLPVLFQIQTIESRLQVLKKTEEQARNSVQLAQTATLLNEIHGLSAELENKRRAIQNSNRKLELELKSGQEHLAVEEKKLYGGSVTNSRELELIQQKIAEYKKNTGKLEDEVFQLMEQDEALGAQIDGLQKRKAACEQEIAVLKTGIEQKLREIGIEVEGLAGELREISVQVPEEWLARFHKIAGSHHGIGIAQVKTDNCGACHVSLSDMLLQKVKRGEDAIVCCENCGRILYY